MRNKPFKNKSIKIDKLDISFNHFGVTLSPARDSDIPPEDLHFNFKPGSPEYQEIRQAFVNSRDFQK